MVYMKLNRLPKKVLDLFPIWEYQCPNCHKFVEPAISFCPYCKTVFEEEKWRVPPRFLKNNKAMSDYAHNVLAPKLTEKQRKLLFEYFTILFSSGFEPGDLTEWTSNVTSGGTIVAETIHPHIGKWDAKVNVNAGGASAYVYVNLGATYPILDMRLYVRFKILPITAGDVIYLMRMSDSGAWLDVWVTTAGSGANNWALWVNETSTGYTASNGPSNGIWYCVEVKRDVTNTAIALWVDGVLALSQAVAISVNAQYCYAGFISGGLTTAVEFYLDDVVVTDGAYIGCLQPKLHHYVQPRSDPIRFQRYFGDIK